MPRAARKASNSGIYHVILRGINKQRIFEDEADYRRFLRILEDCKASCGFELYAYCLMSNHIHILLKTGEEPLERIFRRIGARFVYWYNAKYQRVGHLFQDRYKSEPVEDDTYFLTVVRYIHQNPVKAGLCATPADYPYSSFPHYFDAHGLIDSGFILEMIGKEEFLRYHNAKNEDRCLDIPETKKLPVTDEKAERIMWEITRCKNATEFQSLPTEQRNRALERMLKSGASIRQVSRMTGVSFGVVRKYE